MKALIQKLEERKKVSQLPRVAVVVGTIKCPVTGEVLFNLMSDHSQRTVAPYGQCEECKLDVHESALALPEGTDFSRHVVIHQGRYCKECWVKPIDTSDYDKS